MIFGDIDGSEDPSLSTVATKAVSRGKLDEADIAALLQRTTVSPPFAS